MGNSDHMKLLKEMGITIMALDDGRVQLVHAFGNVSVVSCPAGMLKFYILKLKTCFSFWGSQAATSADAEEGLIFMQEMVELSKTHVPQMDTMHQAVSFADEENQLKVIPAGPAHFGRILQSSSDKVKLFPLSRSCHNYSMVSFSIFLFLTRLQQR